MPTVEMVMPKMGESVQEGTVIAWKVKPGDRVEKDQILLDIATDKVDTEVPSPSSGIITEILANADETVAVGSVIARISDEAGTTAAPATAKAPVAAAPVAAAPAKESAPVAKTESAKAAPVAVASAPAAAGGGAAVDMVMPKMGESVQEGTVIAWKVKVGDKVEKDQILLEIATDKVDTEVPSPASGVLTEILANADETVAVGTVIARIGGSGTPTAPSAQAPSAPASSAKTTARAPEPVEARAAAPTSNGHTTDIPRRSGENFFSPLVRKIAKDRGVTLGELLALNGSGQSGRVTKSDLLSYLENRGTVGAASSRPAAASASSRPSSTPTSGGTPTASSASPSAKPATASSKPALVSGLGEKKPLEALGLDPSRVTVSKLNFMRKKIAAHMRDSLDTAAHVYSVHEVDMTACWEIREAVKDEFKKTYGTSLTFTSFIAWATARALMQYPVVNARLNGDEVILHNYVNLGMAVALPDNGLVVPKIRDAESMTITGLQRKITDLANRARDGKLSPDELQGGTFTITNMGSGNTLIGLAVISQPEAAILGVGAIQQRPMIKNGGIVPRHMMYVSLSYDHRLVDGMLAAQFLTAVTKELEGINPAMVGLDRRKG